MVEYFIINKGYEGMLKMDGNLWYSRLYTENSSEATSKLKSWLQTTLSVSSHEDIKIISINKEWYENIRLLYRSLFQAFYVLITLFVL